ncbi:ATP-binding cassette domain-containing protein [Saccharopolyspora indica]|uniref:ATP-binding cassette domain-containing protein n=1 Tax=Saccharopolyspora indica TaxID=1229659 RepID=UPI0022EAB0E3|nr:ATP-binding cassette domain-containing protein [Saccharopolyspora indica]MDA3645726.1 ATP-binding cassette domain-containing protein [Saccharopolyspora indica]
MTTAVGTGSSEAPVPEGVDLAIEAFGLVKKFGSHRAVAGVDLAVPAGSVYGVLGPNGAGKTTTVKMLSTLLRPDGGTARVLGHDVVLEPDSVRRSISLTGQYASVDEELTAAENVTLLARLLGHRKPAAVSRAEQLLEAFGLGEAAGRQVKNFSGGMRRRLDIACSILSAPRLLFLDEPTTGLDPRSRNQVWEIVRALADGGTTVLLTTQYLEEADQLAARIAVIDRGVVIAENTPDGLKESVGAGSVSIRLQDPEQRAAAQQVLGRVLGVEAHPELDAAVLSARLSAQQAGLRLGDRMSAAFGELSREGIAIAGFSLGRPSLDEVFLALTDENDETTEESR